MEPAVPLPLPQYIFFDISVGGLRCFRPAPAVEHAGVPFDAQVLGLEALRRTRLSRAELQTHRMPFRAGTAMSCDRRAQTTSDPDTVSDAGTSGVQVTESEDEADSSDEPLFEERLLKKIDALAELVGMKGAYEPAAVLGEVVRVLQEMELERGRSP